MIMLKVERVLKKARDIAASDEIIDILQNRLYNLVTYASTGLYGRFRVVKN
jgi:hypothetical protein